MNYLNALQSPYDNLRPKGFFSARKYKMVEEILTSKSGKTFNPSYERKSNLKSSLSMDYDASLNELKVLLPWVLFLTMAIINLLIIF